MSVHLILEKNMQRVRNRVPPLIKILVGIVLKIQLKEVLFFWDHLV